MLDASTIIDIIRFTVGVIILIYASYTDIKTRMAYNFLWQIMIGAGLILLLLQYLLIGIYNVWHLLFIPVMIGLYFVFFKLRLLYGGADFKALAALTILAPFFPAILHYPLFGPSYMPFPWVILVNSLIFFLLIPVGLFFYNIMHHNVKFPHAFLGYFSSIENARKRFVWPLEITVDGRKKFSWRPKGIDPENQYMALEKEGITNIWVTPKVPFMIPLLFGFISSFVLGDILTTIMLNIIL